MALAPFCSEAKVATPAKKLTFETLIDRLKTADYEKSSVIQALGQTKGPGRTNRIPLTDPFKNAEVTEEDETIRIDFEMQRPENKMSTWTTQLTKWHLSKTVTLSGGHGIVSEWQWANSRIKAKCSTTTEESALSAETKAAGDITCFLSLRKD